MELSVYDEKIKQMFSELATRLKSIGESKFMEVVKALLVLVAFLQYFLMRLRFVQQVLCAGSYVV